MGRLTLNILLSFAQFEREVIGERIRDKVAASKKKGMWMGGYVPLGYDVVNRKLIVNEAEAAQVRCMFELFARSVSTAAVIRALNARGIRSKRGRPIDRGALYKLLHNRLYRGEITHKDETLSQYARAHCRCGAVGRCPCGVGRQPEPARRAHPQHRTGAAARADLHRDRRRDDPAPH
ncbi:recombinase family protein [Ruegeria sp. PrR005]|uniref:recombinase family protein n=1 Tax=Ruegeria sp. PrR005 TaxID=2706882 RepID=UPI001EF3AD1F|nr:recombinase family protein [Ruegeria sp. PrR005]